MSEEKNAMSSEQAADLAALEAAAQAEAEIPPAQAKAEAAAVESQNAQAMTDAGMILKIARPLLERIFPACRGADDAAWDCLQEPVANLFAHYGVGLGDVLQNPWAQLGLAAVPLGYHVWENAEKAKAIKAPEPGPDLTAPAPETAPGSKDAVIGGAVVEAGLS